MNWGKFKDPVCYKCLVSYVVTFWFLCKRLQVRIILFYKKFVLLNSVKTFKEYSIVVNVMIATGVSAVTSINLKLNTKFSPCGKT